MMMTSIRKARSGRRAGITLTEILISIMILGVGLVSLAALFPIGLLRLREAQRQSRSAYLSQSASADLLARGLLTKSSFLNSNISPWYFSTTGYFDPWIQDTPWINGAPGDWAGGGDPTLVGVYRGLGGYGKKHVLATDPPLCELDPPLNHRAIPGPGLPVAYDPLWRFFTHSDTSGRNGFSSFQNPPATIRDGYFPGLEPSEARFGSGIGLVRPNGDPFDGGPPNAWGLQRLTNLSPLIRTTWTAVPNTFVSPEDVVWQDPTTANAYTMLGAVGGATVNNPSAVVPDLNMSLGLQTNDWRFTWMFTGRRVDALGGSNYEGEIVIFENRPFAIDQVRTLTGIQHRVAGEPVVEAVFGYGGSIGIGNTIGFGVGSNNLVVLLWPSSQPDPEVKAGGWIADVTYERNNLLAATRFANAPSSAQRCYWYQVAKVAAAADANGTPYYFTSLQGSYRYMLMWVNTKLRAQTLLQVNANGFTEPVTTNAALVSPYVVNVIPRTFAVP
jgi:hypothetical protein